VRALLVAVVAALGLPAAALGHASLVRTLPANGAVSARAPHAVRVVFDDTVSVGPGNRAVRNGGGSVLAGSPHVERGRTLVLPLEPNLARGDYSVVWSIVSDDGHPESGVIAFGVGKGRPPPVAQLSARAGSLTFANVVARWLFLAGVLAAVGTAVFSLSTRTASEAVPLVITSAAVAAALGAADAAHASELSTRAGQAFVAASIYGIVVATVAAVATLEPRALRPSLWLALPLVLAPTAAGHALDRAVSRINVPADVLHVAGAAAWVGALIGICLTREVGRAAWLALAGVALLSATGVVRAVYELRTFSQLWDTGYGRPIIVKTALLLVTLAVGWLLRASARRRAAIELVLVAGIVAAAAVLVLERPGRTIARAATPPAASGEPAPAPPAPPRNAIVVAREFGQYGVALASEPARLTAYVLSPAGGGADGLDVQIDRRDAQSCGHGCYRVDGRHGTSAPVTVGAVTHWLAAPSRRFATRRSLDWFVGLLREERTVEYDERLASSPTRVVRSRWRLEAPNKVSYAIRGGAQAIIIGARRWDRATPAARWVESPQTPLQQPRPPWNKATNVWQISTHHIVFVDPTIPAYFDLEAHEFPTSLHMVAAAHFMTDRYVSFGSPSRLRAPR
jgi:copper transport protein